MSVKRASARIPGVAVATVIAAVLSPLPALAQDVTLRMSDGGLEITEPILITEAGVECLCNTPRKLFVKE